MQNIKNLLPLVVLLFSYNFVAAQKSETLINKPPGYVVEIEAIDYAFKMPSEIKSGWVTFKFKNTGHEMHFGMLLKFNDSVSEEDFYSFSVDPNKETFQKYIKEPPVLVGGPGFHAGGQKSETTMYLEPGNYAMLCNTRTPDGIMHRKLGMRKYFKISEEMAEAKEPPADVQLDLKQHFINADGKLTAGRNTVAIEHIGGDTFDVHLVKLNDTSTISETLRFMETFQEPTQALFSGGAEQKSVERKTYVTIDFEPGQYAWVSHEYGAMGMLKKFTIPEDGSSVAFDRMVNRVFREVPIVTGQNSISIADSLKKGPIKLVHKNPSAEHNIGIGRLEEDKTFGDYMDYIEKVIESNRQNLPVEVENPRTGYKIYFDEREELKFHLRPGNYVLFCEHKNSEGEITPLDKEEIVSFKVY